jgi:phosphatidylinositol glycan class K
VSAAAPPDASTPTSSAGSSHASNWAVIVDTSRFWFNYRHAANSLSVYHAIKKLGIPDDHIILMLAGQPSCDPRNPFPGQIYNVKAHDVNIYDTTIEVDYRGLEVTVENFIQVLTGRHPPGRPKSKRIDTDDGSNILVYMTGHGGDQFLKFQDTHEISTPDLEEAFLEMDSKGRYNEILFIADTCQAATLMTTLQAPRMVTIGSSKLDQSSYSYVNDPSVGVSLVDRFTLQILDFFKREVRVRPDGTSTKSMHDLFATFNPQFLRSDPEWTVRLEGGKRLERIPVTDFFGSVTQVRKTEGVAYRPGEGRPEEVEAVGEAVEEAVGEDEEEAAPGVAPVMEFSRSFLGLAVATIGSLVVFGFR